MLTEGTHYRIEGRAWWPIGRRYRALTGFMLPPRSLRLGPWTWHRPAYWVRRGSAIDGGTLVIMRARDPMLAGFWAHDYDDKRDSVPILASDLMLFSEWLRRDPLRGALYAALMLFAYGPRLLHRRSPRLALVALLGQLAALAVTIWPA